MRALVILLMLAGAGYWWHNRRERYQQLESLQMELKAVEGMIAEKKKLADSLTGKVIPLREGQAAITAEDGSPDKLQEEVAALREAMTTGAAQLDAAEDDFAAAVEAKKSWRTSFRKKWWTDMPSTT
jgi:chromosome segregation ATPase